MLDVEFLVASTFGSLVSEVLLAGRGPSHLKWSHQTPGRIQKVDPLMGVSNKVTLVV